MTLAPNDPLWDKLSTFCLDVPASALSFSQRLARENDWSPDFTRRVLEEYRRFLFLAARAGHPVTPSDEVDQAWHLHLVYTESYWNDLCRDILGKPLHHGPTRGGSAEGGKFAAWYARTLESYEKIFAQAPPPDIWPASERRFAPARHCRVNKADWWMVSRAGLKRTLRSAAIVIGGVVTLCLGLSACKGGEGSTGLLLFFGALVVWNIIKSAGGKGRTGKGSKDGGGCSTGSCGSSGCSSSGSSSSHSGGHGSGCGSHGGDGGGSSGGDGGGSSGCGSSCGGGCGGGGD